VTGVVTEAAVEAPTMARVVTGVVVAEVELVAARAVDRQRLG
jgi:hypothetical protein